MRILFTDHTSIVGGAQRSLLELMHELRGHHDVALAAPTGDLAHAAAALEVELLPVPDSQLAFRIQVRATPAMAARSCAAAGQLLGHARRWHPDILHANSIRAGLIATPSSSTASLVTHCRDVLPPSRLGSVVKAATLRSARRTVAISRYVATALAGPDWFERGVRVVDNPIDMDRFALDRTPKTKAQDLLGLHGSPMLVMVGQITPWKKQDHAIRVLAELRKRRPDACLAIVGRPLFVSNSTSFDNVAYERELHALVDDLDLGSAVHWVGHREDPETVLAAGALVLAPSAEEPFGRTIVEALAMGLPVVATSIGGPPEIVRPLDGVTLPPTDPVAWANAVDDLLTADATHRREVRRAYAVERFAPTRHAAHMLDVYREALG